MKIFNQILSTLNHNLHNQQWLSLIFQN